MLLWTWLYTKIYMRTLKSCPFYLSTLLAIQINSISGKGSHKKPQAYNVLTTCDSIEKRQYICTNIYINS